MSTLLTQTSREYLTKVAGNADVLDQTSKDLFITLHKDYVRASSVHFKDLKKEVEEYLKETITSDVIRNAVKRVATVAYKWADKKVLSNTDKLLYDNIRTTITLLTYVEKEHGAEEARKVRNKLARVGGKNDNKAEYNNKYLAKLQALKTEYKVVLTDSDDAIKVDPTKALKIVETNLDKYTIKQLEELKALVESALK